MDAALGCRANVFQVQHSTTKRSAAGTSFGGSVNIHPQAAQLVCQHVMDALIYLSKVFTSHFLPPHVALPADSGLVSIEKFSVFLCEYCCAGLEFSS